MMIPEYNTMLFTNVWDSQEKFIFDIKEFGLNKLKDDSLKTLYKLLYAKYGNNPIANRDVNQFKAKVSMVIFEYGPTWEKRVEIQDAIRALNDDEIRAGNRIVVNRANNPDIEPTEADASELPFISEQNATNQKKGILEGYSLLLELLKTNVTGEFIEKFKICFKQIVIPENPLLYVSEKEDE